MYKRADSDYDSNLLHYITDYTKKNMVPPTVDQMITNVDGLKSKSSVFCHLQHMVESGLLVQKNVLGCYYPKALEEPSCRVPEKLIVELGKYIVSQEETEQRNVLLADLQRVYKALEKEYKGEMCLQKV